MKRSIRQIQKDETREKLLSAAHIVFGQKGIMAARMSDIAEAAGVSHGTVFVHFKTQETLVAAVIDDFGIRMGQRTHDMARNSGSLRDVLKAHLEGIREDEAFYTQLVIETRSLPPIARETMISIQSAVSFHINQAAQREMDAGVIKPMSMALLFNTWIGLVHYYLTNRDLFSPEKSVIKTCGSMLIDHFMHMISSAN